jgi:non-ribosomal peptide synthetase component E (peptide arylation enzyme)
MLNLAIVLMENAQRLPDHTAVIFDERRLTYRALELATNQLAGSQSAPAWTRKTSRSRLETRIILRR